MRAKTSLRMSHIKQARRFHILSLWVGNIADLFETQRAQSIHTEITEGGKTKTSAVLSHIKQVEIDCENFAKQIPQAQNSESILSNVTFFEEVA